MGDLVEEEDLDAIMALSPRSPSAEEVVGSASKTKPPRPLEGEDQLLIIIMDVVVLMVDWWLLLLWMRRFDSRGDYGTLDLE